MKILTHKGLFFLWLILVFNPHLMNSVSAIPLGTPDKDLIEYPEDQPPSEQEIDLGKKLFFDKRLSINSKQSCATCHDPQKGFGDGRKTGIGTKGNILARNVPPLYNLAWNKVFFWDGRASSLEEQALGPIQSTDEMGMSVQELIGRLKRVPEYKKMFTKIYGEEEITAENLARAIAAFERNIISDNSPFDRFLKGDHLAMGASAQRGFALFLGKAQCILCHDGPNFTDSSFHNIGVDSGDIGRSKIVNTPVMFKAFKTPGLRNVALTAPYMHNGSEETLEQVIQLYNEGGRDKSGIDPLIKPLKLSEEEIKDLVNFLNALTDPVKIN